VHPLHRLPERVPLLLLRICFAEQSQPQWVGIGSDASDTQLFQLMRMYHMVGAVRPIAAHAALFAP